MALRAGGSAVSTLIPLSGGTITKPAGRSPGDDIRARVRAVAAVVLLHLVVLADPPGLVLQVLLGGLALVGLPTWATARHLARSVQDRAERWLFALGATLLLLMLGGVVVNGLLGAMGVTEPLGYAPIVLMSMVIGTALTATIPAKAAGDGRAHERAFAIDAPLMMAALGAVVTVGGALRLNNGGEGTPALIGTMLGIAALAGLLLRRGQDRGQDVMTLWLVGVGLLLGVSLRGWGLSGHDIQQEFLVYSLTHVDSHWEMADLEDAYNACLSITILPHVLATMTAVPGAAVFRLLMPLVFALVPVTAYLVARRMVVRRAALIGTIVLLSYPPLATDMPYLVRQQMAFFFIGLVLLAASQPLWSVRGRRAATIAAGVGVVLSHYSSSYLLLGSLVLGALMVPIVRWSIRRRRRTPLENDPVLLWPGTIAVLLAACWVWAGPVTGSSGHAQNVIRETMDQWTSGADVLGSSDVRYAMPWAERPTAQERMTLYTAQAQPPDPFTELLLDDAGEVPQVVDRESAPLTPVGTALEGAGASVGPSWSLARIGSALIIQVWLVIGMAVALWGRRPRHRVTTRAGLHPVEGQFFVESIALGLGATAVTALTVVLPGLSVEYGVLRVFLQALLVLVPVVSAGAITTAEMLGRRAHVIVSGLVVGMILVLTGVLPYLTGGAAPSLRFANSGHYYDVYYGHQAEALGFRWAVAQAAAQDATLVSDDYTLRRTMWIPREVPTRGSLFPAELPAGTWALLGAQTVASGGATVGFAGDQMNYRYPVEDLAVHADRIYDNGTVEVYR